MLNDPFPRQLLLGSKELRMLLGLDRSAWAEFLAHPPPEFPRAVAVGTTASGADRARWKKAAVYLWLDTLPAARPNRTETHRSRPKRAGAVEPPSPEG